MIFDLFKKQVRDDPQFGSLVKKGGKWTGKLCTPLLPGVDAPIVVAAKDDAQLAACRIHLEQVLPNCETIRSQIGVEAFETYQMYKKQEEGTEPYEDIASAEKIWPLIKPREWLFDPNGTGFKSAVAIDFDWPNDHFLVAYLEDTALHLLEVSG